MSLFKRRQKQFQKCDDCGSTKTSKIATIDGASHYAYIGWCSECQDPYIYRIEISTVQDKTGRL